MSTFKRITSLLLALVILVGMLPAGAAAAETSVDTGEMTIAGTNSLGALLSEEIQTQQEVSAAANEAYEAGFSVTDLTFSGATATVTYDAVEKATLVVAVYTEDGMTLLNSAYTQVSPDETNATVTLSGEMPKFFAASAYLLNTYDLSPLCPAYDTPVYTQSMQELLSSTVEDYPEERVLNLDDDNTTNFAVYAENTVVVEEKSGVNTVISVNDETMTYVIGNADAQVTSLQSGDVVVYPYGDHQFIIAKVASVSVSGTTVTISGGELDVEDVFSHVKIEGDSSNAEITYDPSTLSDGLTVAHGIGPDSDEISATGTLDMDFDLFDNGTVSGSLGFQLAVSVNYYAVEEVCYLELRDDAQITLNAQFSGEYSASMCLGRFGVAFLYGTIYVGLEPAVNFSAEAEAEFTGTVSAMVGARVESDRGAFAISEAPKASYDLRVEGSVYLGLDLNPTLEILGGVLADGDLTLAVGVRIDGELTGGITSGSTEEIEPEDTIHTCEACIDLNGYCQLDFQASVQFFRQEALTFSTEEHQKDIHLGQWYYSVDQDEFDEGECPYKSHRVSIEVLDSDGVSVSGVAVEVSQAGQVEENGYTGGNGVYSVYLSEGSHTIRAVHGELRRTVTENVTEPGKVTITLPETPDEPEETTPSAPGGVLEGGDSVPAGGSWELEESGWFASNPAMTWEIYSGSAGTKVVFTGSGEVDNVLISSGRYEYYDEEHDQTVEKEKNVWPAATEVVFGEGITAITTHVDADRSVSLPSTLREIGDNVFYKSELKQISLPAGLQTIGAGAFAQSKLEGIAIPGSVKEIGAAAFECCFKLEQVVLGEGVTQIGAFAFTSCPELKTIQLPSTLKVIGQSAFDASDLQAITIPGSVQEIGMNAFLGCANLRSVTILPGVTCIGEYTFQGCSSMTSLSLPEGLKRIEAFAFHHCDSLTDVTIPKTVEFIGQHAFSYCRKLKNLTFEGFDLADGKDYGITFHSLAFELCAVTELKLPAIDSAWGLVFKECEYLDTITLDGCIYELHDEGGEGGYGGSPLADCDPGTIYYPDAYSEENLPANDPAAAAYYYTKDRMWDIHSGATWIPYTVDESGNMIPDESRAYCPYTGGWYSFGNSSETIPEETATETIPEEAVPTETIPEMMEPAETAPIETEAPETVPVETAETLPEETNSFVSVELPTPAGANVFRVDKPRAEIRSLSNEEITVGEEITAPALDALFGGDYSSEVTEDKTVKTASFSGLVPGEEYLLLALTTLETSDPLSIDSLIHIDQGTASAEGTLIFHYVERDVFYISYVMVSGPSGKSLKDATVFFPKVYASGSEQMIRPTVIYDGIILTEGKDYTLSGKVAFRAAGTYTCYIQGIGDYTGTVECTYEVLPCQRHTPGAAATCTTAQLCTVCKAELKAPLGHDEIIDAAIAPTCTENGLTEGIHCERCGEIITAQESIPATGHSFENGFCTVCGASDKADFNLFAGKSVTIKPINPETNKAYTAKQLEWSMDEIFEPFVKLAKGKITAQKVVEKARVEVVAKVVATGEELRYTIDVFPAVTQVEVKKGEEIVNGKTVLMDFADKKLVLKADAYPLDTLANVTWTVSDKKGQFAAYEIDGDVLTISNPTGKAGTVTIKATVDAGVKKNITIKVQFASYAETVEISEPEKTTIKGGESLKLTAEITEPDVVSKPGIVWTTSNKTAATVSNGKVTAKNVAHPTMVTITATSKDGQASDSVELRILPKNEGQLVLMNGNAFVTNSTKTLNLGETYQLDAAVITNGEPESEEVTWSTSKASVAEVDENGLVTAVGNGTAKITATAGKVKISMTVKVTTLVDDMEITTKDGRNIINENGEDMVLLPSGKAVNLVANILTPGANKAVTWEITEGKAYAKVSNGKVTANKDLTSVQYVTVRAIAKDGSGYFEEITVKVVPLATGVQIFESGIRVRSNTVYISDLETNPVIRLSAKVYPAKAMQDVDLTSSNKKVAYFDEFGDLICVGVGSTNITATALDGSKQKATFKLTVVNKIADISLKDELPLDAKGDLFIAGGKSLKLATMIDIYPANATNKKLNWSVSKNDAGIKVNASGVLFTKKVTEPVTVNVMALAQDGSGEMLSFNVTVYPATTKLTIWDGGMNVTGKTITLEVGETIKLCTEIVPEGAAGICSWSSSNAAYVSVSEDGTVTAVKGGKTITMTCKAEDGSGKKAIVKIKVT